MSAGTVAVRILLLQALAAPGSLDAQSSSSADMLSDLSAKVGGSVVRISLIGSGDDNEQGNGTGFVVRRDGVVVTNYHVVDDAPSNLVAVFRDGARRRVLGSLALDEEHDLALIRIESGDYPALFLAEATAIKVGQPVFLIGSSSASGSEPRRRRGGGPAAGRVPRRVEERSREAGEKIVSGPLVQHTASSSAGSSGSPVVNLEGKVVAVHHSGIFGTPIYFGAHADALRSLLARTDLDAKPRALGPNVTRNLLISAAVFAALGALFFLPRLLERLPKRRRGWTR